MAQKIHRSAPAKINIGLTVLAGTYNGFHHIESIFQLLSLSDELYVTVQGSSCVVKCSGMDLPSNNTIVSSYEAFCDVTGIALPGLEVELRKRIPEGSGLGGGSSDAASFIRILEEVSEYTLSLDEEAEIASRVGSDVFFFLLRGNATCALVSGRGENVKPIVGRKDLYFVLIFPDVVSSTKEAYSLVDKFIAVGNKTFNPSLAEAEEVYRGPVSLWNFSNSFTPPLVNKFPKIGSAIKDLQASGSLFVQMSGSGSTVYGVFPSLEEAENARCYLANHWEHCLVTQAASGEQ